MGYHMKKDEWWGIEIQGSGFMHHFFVTRKEASQHLAKMRKEAGKPLSAYWVRRCRIVAMDV